MSREVTVADIYHYLKNNDKSKYDVIDIIGEIDSVETNGGEYYGVTCKVTYVDPAPIDIKIEERRCIIDKEVMDNYVKELNAVTWYE